MRVLSSCAIMLSITLSGAAQIRADPSTIDPKELSDILEDSSMFDGISRNALVDDCVLYVEDVSLQSCSAKDVRWNVGKSTTTWIDLSGVRPVWIRGFQDGISILFLPISTKEGNISYFGEIREYCGKASSERDTPEGTNLFIGAQKAERARDYDFDRLVAICTENVSD